MHQGLPCSREKLESVKLHEVVPPSSSITAFSSGKKTFTVTVLTCDDDLINEFKQDLI
jgi:hypothetical protein